jgi:protoporphyrinogen IX oxidase
MSYLTVKALHIIFVVSWFAGLFYIVRLFIYHTEAQLKPSNEAQILSAQFTIMEKKLWWIITTPAMVLTVLFGAWMLVLNPGLLSLPWMHIKLSFVALLLVYHFVCQHLLKKVANGVFTWNSTQLRLWNELATLVLVAVVFLVELQHSMNWIGGTIGFFGVGILLMLLIRIYKKFNSKK